MKPLHLLRCAERSMLVVIFIMMVVLYFTSVVTREVGGTFASQFGWIEEAVRLMNLFLVFLALGPALERGRHVNIEILQDRLSPRSQVMLRRLIDAVGIVFSLYLSWLSLTLVQHVLMTGQRSPTLGLPMGWIYMAPFLGFVLLALRYGLSLFGIINRVSGDMVEQESSE